MNKYDLNALISKIINHSIKNKSKIVNQCSVFDIQKKKMKDQKITKPVRNAGFIATERELLQKPVLCA